MALKRDRVREILNLDVMLIEIVVILLSVVFYVAVGTKYDVA